MSGIVKKKELGVSAVTPQGTLVRESVQMRSTTSDPFSLSMSDLYLVWTDGWARNYFEKTLAEHLYDITIFEEHIRSHMFYGDDDFFFFYDYIGRELDALEDIFAELYVQNIDTVYHIYSETDRVVKKEHDVLIAFFKKVLKRIREFRSRGNDLFLERFSKK